jgi:formate-dependent nitrite reductase membrane component NrfD
MNRNLWRVSGVVVFLVGVVLIGMSISSVTGFVVMEEVASGVSSIIGVIFVIGGLLIAFAGAE